MVQSSLLCDDLREDLDDFMKTFSPHRYRSGAAFELSTAWKINIWNPKMEAWKMIFLYYVGWFLGSTGKFLGCNSLGKDLNLGKFARWFPFFKRGCNLSDTRYDSRASHSFALFVVVKKRAEFAIVTWKIQKFLFWHKRRLVSWKKTHRTKKMLFSFGVKRGGYIFVYRCHACRYMEDPWRNNGHYFPEPELVQDSAIWPYCSMYGIFTYIWLRFMVFM